MVRTPQIDENVYRTEYKILGDFGFYRAIRSFKVDVFIDDMIPNHFVKEAIPKGTWFRVTPAGIYVLGKSKKKIADYPDYVRVAVSDKIEKDLAKNIKYVESFKGHVRESVEIHEHALLAVDMAKSRALREAVITMKNDDAMIKEIDDLLTKFKKVSRTAKGFLKRAYQKEITSLETLKGVISSEAKSANEEVVGTGAIPSGPESIGKPDFIFKGHQGFDCNAGTFGKCLKGKKKYKRWNTFLDRDDELVGRVKDYMGKSYRNTNFVLRNSNTGEMVMARRPK